MAPRNRTRLLAAVLLAALVSAPAGVALGRSVSPALAPSPNNSLVLYKPPANGKPGRVVTGTLVNGVFTRKGAFSTRRWTSIAVGRDSMALYDKGSGKLLTGNFRNGVWKPLRTRTIAKGYTHVVASCDTILLFKRSTRTGRTAELMHGEIRHLQALPTLPPIDLPLMAASCDTLYAPAWSQSGEAPGIVGWLRLGYFERTDRQGAALTYLTANRTSYLTLLVPDSGPANGVWGMLQAGETGFGGNGSDFGRWDVIAGVGDSVLFYIRSTGQTHAWRIVAGIPSDLGPVAGIGKGWRIIMGGR